jgi:peptidyl-prolyl cis-trans isomerase D
MMDFIRNNLKDSFIIKGFLGLLMISFGIWGVGDFIGSGGLDPAIAVQVGKTTIRSEEFRRRYTQEIEKLRQSMGPDGAEQEAVKRSVANAIVQDFTHTATLDGAGLDLGVVITPERLRNEIQNEKAFQGPGGTFSQAAYGQVLASAGMTESSFVKLYAADLRRATMLKPVIDAAAAPKFLVDSLYTYRGEARTADTLLISTANMPIPATPSDDTFKKLYEDNIAAFTAPEYRKLSAVVLTNADLTHPENIDEAEVKTFYDENAERYHGKETRHVVQLVFDSEEKAAAVKAQAAPGDTLETLAAKSKSGSVIDLGDLSTDSPLASTIAAVFVLPAQQISDPIKSDLGWHLFEIKAINAAAPIPYEQVKDEIRKSMAEDKAVDAVSDASVQLEDGLAGGTPLAELAKTVGGKLIQVEAIDREGKDPKGAPVEGLPERESFLRASFATAAGADTGLKSLASRNGYYVVHVDAVTPPTAKPLESVRAEVAAIWARQQRFTQAQELAEKLTHDIGPSTALSSLESSDKRVSYGQLGPIRRFGDPVSRSHIIDSKRVSPEVLDKMFSGKVGDVFSAPVVDGVLIARIKEVSPPAQSTDADVRQLADNVKSSIQSDLADELTKAFGKRFPTEVNTKLIDETIGQR